MIERVGAFGLLCELLPSALEHPQGTAHTADSGGTAWRHPA